jgi:hypothetical protein
MFAHSKYGGDCAAIEHYVLRSFRIALAKLQKDFDNEIFFPVFAMNKG